jgi:hypothetical protein
VSRRATKELVRVAEWMEKNAIQQAERLDRETKEKTMSDKIKVIAGCPELSLSGWTTTMTSSVSRATSPRNGME